jgi:hypothetical protein
LIMRDARSRPPLNNSSEGRIPLLMLRRGFLRRRPDEHLPYAC